MLYILAAIGLYFVFNFISYVIKQNNVSSNLSESQFKTSINASLNPIEDQRNKQKNIPLLSEEMMVQRIGRIYAEKNDSTFEQFQHEMRFTMTKAENEYNINLIKNVLEEEKSFVSKYGFNMNDRQVDIAITRQILDIDEEEMPYW